MTAHPRERADERRRRRLGEPAHRERLHVRERGELVRRALQARRLIAFAEGAHDEHRAIREMAGDEREKPQGQVVGPLKVFQDQQ